MKNINIKIFAILFTVFLLLAGCSKSADEDSSLNESSYQKLIIGEWDSEIVLDSERFKLTQISTTDFKDDNTDTTTGNVKIKGKGLSASVDYKQESVWEIKDNQVTVKSTSYEFFNMQGSQESVKALEQFTSYINSTVNTESVLTIKKLDSKQLILVDEDGGETVLKRH